MSNVSVDAITILLIEDDEEDILLAQRALSRANIWNRVDVVRDGKEALEYLYNEGAYTDTAKYRRPGLVLLDLSLPGIDGRDVLEKICSDPERKNIPVAIISTSDYEKDIEYGRSKGVQHYIIKPAQPDNLLAAMGSINAFHVILGNVAGAKT
ncbi:MAG: response regulator [Lentisphaerota bacterium]